MELHNSVGIVIKQILGGIVCLSVGLGSIWLFTAWANTWNVYYSDGSKYYFGVDAALGGAALIFLIIFVTATQFQSTLSPYEVFWCSIRSSIFIALPFVIIFDILIIFLVGSTLKQLLLVVGFLLMLVISLGLVVGIIQACRLLAENFDPAKHSWLISHKASLKASRSGVLPYRRQVITIWSIIILIVVNIFFVSAPIIGRNHVDGIGFAIGVFIALIVVGVSVAKINEYLKLLSNPSIKFIEGQVFKRRSGYEVDADIFTLFCNDQDFSTDSAVWHEIIEGQSYRLWYSSINKFVVSFEDVMIRTE